MDTGKIKVLLRAIELGSLSKAAEEYLYTPSALSHMVDAIEEEIGTKIIKRTHSGIEVTNKKIVEKLCGICSLQDEIFELAGKKKSASSITIGTYASLAKNVLPEITKTFREKYQGIRVNIIVVNNMSELVDKNGADIYFGEKINVFPGEWLEMTVDDYVAVFPKDDKETSFSSEKKYDKTFIVPNDGKILSYISEKNFKDTIEVNSHDDGVIIQLVSSGEGISVLPGLSVKGFEKQVKILPLEEKLWRRLGIMYNKNGGNYNLIKMFIKHIRENINL